VQLCQGASQRKGRKPQYLTAIVSPEYKLVAGIPFQLNLLSCKARSREKVSLRCVDANCFLRPESQRDDALKAEKEGKEDPERELQPDDLEALGVDEQTQETAEAEEEAEPATTQEALENRRCLVDLWPFAFSAARYATLFQALGTV
jgi:hypothetical protein